MVLQIYISKKGTKVVAATQLHQILQLADHHYPTNIKRWLTDVYEFKDGIRKPVKMQDFANRKGKGNSIVKDYYLSVELAKLITLNSKSKVKQKYAKYLFSLEEQVDNGELLTKEQVLNVLELAKAMGMVSCQESAEKSHLKIYETRNGGSGNNWWKHRAEVMGYSVEKLRRKLQQLGKNVRGKTQRQMLMQVDKYEMIRTGVIDLFMAMGKTERYARNLGDLAKTFAKELNIEIFDDRQQASLFTPDANDQLVNELKAFEQNGRLRVWQ
ncbi:MAG: hypothetical protein KDD01_20250 [Phaeodactylibacter sp.]|nr:hypothetical protein [Phaeodactylibacter sp.]